MRSKWMFVVVVALASVAHAKEPKAYQSGKVVQMDSVQCGTAEKDGKSKKTHELLCQEYVVQSEHVNYRIRPRDEKHPMLLPISDRAQFRIEKDKMLLRVEDADNKEHEYMVVSMTPRTDSSAADAGSTRVNHLQ